LATAAQRAVAGSARASRVKSTRLSVFAQRSAAHFALVRPRPLFPERPETRKAALAGFRPSGLGTEQR